MNKSELRRTIRSIMLPFFFSAFGLLVAFLLKKGLGLEISKLSLSLIALAITSAAVLLLFPRVFKIPFGSVSTKEFIKNLGLYKPQPLAKLMLLGLFASLFTLTGMLIGSLLTGKYIFSTGTITLTQAVFSLTPGIWEEILFRGVIMIVLLRLTKSYKKACVIQILIFGLGHIKDFDLLGLVDAFSVIIIAVAFTYIAYKTKSLIPGMIMHYVHDTLLFAVQLPGGDYFGFQDNMFFYAGLWISIALCLVMIKLFVERFSIISPYDFYAIHSGVKNPAGSIEKCKMNLNNKTKEAKMKGSLMIFTTLVFVAGLIHAADLKKLNLDDASAIGTTIQTDIRVKTEGKGSIKITTQWPTTICLGEVTGLEIENAMLVYKAKVKSDLEGTAFLEMWAHVGTGQYFSREMNNIVKQKTDWKIIQTPFLFQKGQKPDKVTLNLVINGKGTVWIDDIVLSKEPLK